MKVLLIISLFILTSNLQAKRIVSIGLSVTEIIAEFDAYDEIIACDNWSKKVMGTEKAIDLGNIWNINFQKVKELKPDLIFIDGEYSYFGNSEKAEKLGLKVEYLPKIYSKSQIEKNIYFIAKKIGKESSWDKVRDNFRMHYTDFELAKLANKINSKVIYLDTDYKNGIVIAGEGTVPYAMLQDIGNKIKYKSKDWKSVDIKEINSINPDVILVSSKLVQSLGGNESAVKYFASTRAGKNDKIVVVDDWEFKSYSVNIAGALLKIMGIFNEDGFK